MENIVLFCKSYGKDMLRAKRLADSIDRFNRDNIPFYLSVPQSDLEKFKDLFKDNQCIFVTDEQIVEKSCKAFGAIPDYFSSHLMQQLIKMEFWRMGKSHNYAWVDSDSYFIKDFKISDFMHDEKVPFTIRQEYDPDKKRERWKNVPEGVREKRIDNGMKQVAKFQTVFGRETLLYDFGVSTPIIWSSRVLTHLYEKYLIPNEKSIFRLLADHPCETFLYGYYLMHTQCMPVFPRPHMFKNFDYADEFIASEIMGENEYSIAKKYWGICMQSNWALFKEKKSMAERLKNRKQELLGLLSKFTK